MTLTRRLGLAIFLGVIVVFGFVWWNRPVPADMAAFAPADAFVYLESNSIADIAAAISQTDTWRKLGPLVSEPNWNAGWLEAVVRWTGIGPAQSVVAARAQLAAVVLNVGANEEAETLRIKPELAVIIETHTGSRRTRPLLEQLLTSLARNSYGAPTYKTQNVQGNEFLIWTAPSGDRELVATIDDTIVIVGNSQGAVEACLAVRKGRRPSLQGNPEVERMRSRMEADHALAFGFVPAANSSQLVSLATPLFLGRAELESSFQKIISVASSKILGGIGWSAFAVDGEIEDRYLISLQAPVLSRLRSGFKPASDSDPKLQTFRSLSNSATTYRFDDPAAAWTALESAVLSQLDALSTVVFKSLLKSALSPYGIEDPQEFLKLVGPQLMTVRLTSSSDKAVVIGQLRDQEAMKELQTKLLGPGARSETYARGQVFAVAGKEFSLGHVDGYFLLGSPDDLRACMDHLAGQGTPQNTPSPNRATESKDSVVVTATDENQDLREFFYAMARARGTSKNLENTANFDRVLDQFPRAVTSTALGTDGIERRTRSALGQFGQLVTLSLSQ